MQLNIQNLGRKYSSDFWGLKEFSLQVDTGIVALLGPNGAGKSTFMRMLATVSKPTEGKIMWQNTDVSKQPDLLRSMLGYLPQDFGVYPNLNAIEFLEYIAAIKGLQPKVARQRIDELLQVVNLGDAAKRPLGEYSTGMKRRVGIAQALLNDPQLLIVDEPTAGLDPEERVRFRNLLSDLSGERIIIFSTHIVSDVEAVAMQVVLLNKGRIVCTTLPETLLKQVEGRVWEWVVPSDKLATLKQTHMISSTSRRSDGMHVRAVSEHKPDAHAISRKPNLEDAYLYLLRSTS